MLMTAGVKYGFGRTLPHLAGVILGFGLMIAVIGLGLDVLFKRFPQILPIMRIAGSLYMIWLALRIALATYGGVVDDYTRSVLFIAALSALIAVPCSGAWTLFGSSLSRLLMDPRVIRPFNWTMAALLVASIAPMLFE